MFPNILRIEVTQHKLNLNFVLAFYHFILFQEMKECSIKTKPGSLEKADDDSFS